MADSQEDSVLGQLDENFQLLGTPAKARTACELAKLGTEEWKRKDPEGYRKDMMEMCKAMFGEHWHTEYEAMLREEFPRDFS